MRFLDIHDDVGGDDDYVIAELNHLSSIIPSESDGGETLGACLLKSRKDVLRVARNGDAEKDTTGLSKSLYLTVKIFCRSYSRYQWQ